MDIKVGDRVRLKIGIREGVVVQTAPPVLKRGHNFEYLIRWQKRTALSKNVVFWVSADEIIKVETST